MNGKKYYLQYKDEIVAVLQLDMSLVNIIILRVEDITDNAPYILKAAKSLNLSQEQLCIIAESWIKNRCISGRRIDIDNYLIARYGLVYNKAELGRMGSTRYTTTVLSYGISPFDYFWLNPANNYTQCYIYQDRSFNQMRLIRHLDSYNDMLALLNNNPEFNIGICNAKESAVKWVPTYTDTINSISPTYYAEVDNIPYIFQDISNVALLDENKSTIISNFLKERHIAHTFSKDCLQMSYSQAEDSLFFTDIMTLLEEIAKTNPSLQEKSFSEEIMNYVPENAYDTAKAVLNLITQQECGPLISSAGIQMSDNNISPIIIF